MAPSHRDLRSLRGQEPRLGPDEARLREQRLGDGALKTAYFSVLGTLLLLGTLIVPGAVAQDFEAREERTIDLRPTPTFPTDQPINLAEIGTPEGTDLEKDFLEPAFMEVGRYVGPYLHSSNFRFTYETGGIFRFNATFNFTREQIMSGASTFWVRWPVNANEYDQFCLYIRNYFRPGRASIPPDFPILENSDVYARCANPAGPSDINLLANCASCELKHDPPPPKLGDHSILSSTGIYTKEWAWLMPEREYVFEFIGHLRDDTSPSIWATIEKYQVENATTYQFANYLIGSNHTETVPLYPAFAWNFVAGIGDGGVASYLIPFNGSNRSHFFFNGIAPDMACEDHVSVYLPFFGADTVNFTINMTVSLGDPPGDAKQEWSVDAQNFLLTSSPNSILQLQPGCDDFGGTLVRNVYVWITANKPIYVLGSIPDEPVLSSGIAPLRNVPWALVLDDGRDRWGNDEDYTSVQYPAFNTPGGGASSWRVIPLHALVKYTGGRWATVTPGELYTVYNFGWGRAYLFPGEVSLVMFLNNGTAIGFDSIATFVSPGSGDQCQGIFQNVEGAFQPIADWINKLACFIMGLFGDVIGTLTTVFQAIWNGIKALGEWVYNALIGFIDAVVKIATAIIEIAEQIVFSLLTAFPFIFVLFIAGRGLPDLIDAKREIKKGLRQARQRRGLVFRPARKAVEGGRKLRSRFRRRREKEAETTEKEEET